MYSEDFLLANLFSFYFLDVFEKPNFLILVKSNLLFAFLTLLMSCFKESLPIKVMKILTSVVI